jgi:hypothetical protein
MAVKEKARECFAARENAENLTLLVMVAIIEVSITLELAYWMLSILVSMVIFSREGWLIFYYAGEAQRRIEEAVLRALEKREAERSTEEVKVPVAR